MSRIKEEEIRLFKIASALEENPYRELFEAPEDTQSSYMAKEETGYITDYGFETPGELLRLLTDQWEGEACRNELLAAASCIAAAVFKQEPDGAKGDGQVRDGRTALFEDLMEDPIEVPMFIYNF